jgi:hypothetical protein
MCGNELFVSDPLTSALSQTITVTGDASTYVNPGNFTTVDNSYLNFDEGNVLGYEEGYTAGQCEALCSSNPNCSGAGFFKMTESNAGICYALSGNIGPPVQIPPTAGLEYTTYINKTARDAAHLDTLNQELMDLNEQIKEVYNNNNFMQIEMSEVTKTSNVLDENYRKLLIEKEKIAELMKERDYLSEDLSDQNDAAKQGNFAFFFWLILAIVAIIVAIRVFVS